MIKQESYLWKNSVIEGYKKDDKARELPEKLSIHGFN
jgi:hypothetical protein